ncbi:MAG: PepSY domain-containing protein [Thermoguttaceae bacterium]|nr:PepSY domain-containing protein [Thermoguttaceae bacterium]
MKNAIGRIFSRKIWRQVHVALGIACSIVFAIVCATGAIYLFRDELGRVVEPERYWAKIESASESDKPSLDDLVANLERAEGARAETVVVPRERRRTLRFLLKPDGAGNRRILRDVDPFSGKVVGSGADKATPFFKGVRRWHVRLNLPKKLGTPIVDVCCLAALVLAVSGLRIWIPAQKSLWKRRLTVRFRSGVKTALYDLHVALGFWGLVPLALLAISGAFFAFYSSHASVAPPMALPESVSEERGVSLDELIRESLADAKGRGALKITLPGDQREEAIRIERTGGGFWSFSVPTVYYWDPRNGSLVAERSFRDLDGRNKLMAIVRGCHYGDLFGTGSKIVFCFGCLAGIALVVTGIWFELVKKSPRKRE